MSRGLSTPRRASCSSCATRSRRRACASSRSISRPHQAARQALTFRPPKSPPAIPMAPRRSSPAIAARRWRRWRRLSRHSLRPATISAGLISAGGSGATALATPAMQSLAVGVPKVMVSTVASGDVRAYVGPADICMIYSVTDVSGLNRISTMVLANAAHALAGMIGLRRASAAARQARDRPDHVRRHHALRAGGRRARWRTITIAWCSMRREPAASRWRSSSTSHLLAGVIDVTTTEIADHLAGGILSAGEGRLDAIIRAQTALCRLLRRARHGQFRRDEHASRSATPSATLYAHNPQVTLMRTNAAGERRNRRLDRRQAQPHGGAGPLFAAARRRLGDRRAGQAVLRSRSGRGAVRGDPRRSFRPTPRRRLIETPYAINDPAFAALLVEAFREIIGA